VVDTEIRYRDGPQNTIALFCALNLHMKTCEKFSYILDWIHLAQDMVHRLNSSWVPMYRPGDGLIPHPRSPTARFDKQREGETIRRGADKSVAFPISYFLICSTTKRIFLGWVKEVRTTKSLVCGAQGGICRVNAFLQSGSLSLSL
jgi:hypothetical protein